MKTTDLIIYGALIYLFYKLNKKENCSCNANQPGVKNDTSVLNLHTEDITPNDFFNCGNTLDIINKGVLNLPKFTKIDPETIDATQIIPTPASILSPEQLAIYNASIKGFRKQKYVC